MDGNMMFYHRYANGDYRIPIKCQSKDIWHCSQGKFRYIRETVAGRMGP